MATGTAFSIFQKGSFPATIIDQGADLMQSDDELDDLMGPSLYVLAEQIKFEYL